MGHRKKNAPRHGSLAYLPRGRSRTMNPIIRAWPKIESEKATLLGGAAFKTATIHMYTVDDREKTPNFGKPRFNMATVLEAPPLFISGFRCYCRGENGFEVLSEVYSKHQPKEMERKKKFNDIDVSQNLEFIKNSIDKISRFVAICCITPSLSGVPQKTPILFEIEVGGGSPKEKLEYLESILGKNIKISDIFSPGIYVDTVGITRGKGFEGPVTRMGIKRKQHKSRKTVRAVGTIGPWKPSATMYTVPSAGQRGLHRRTEYNKRILSLGSSESESITPKGGFAHYGVLKSDYLIVKGSIQGPPKRFIKLRYSIRNRRKIQPPKVLEISIKR
jgi:large subunit ribosomal protein L3